MYGLIPRAIESMVLSRFGHETWAQIKKEAGVDIEIFIRTSPYPDEITYGLVGATSRVLGLPVEQVLEEFGEYWVLVTAEQDYASIMQASGPTLSDFLQDLNDMHERVGTILPALQPPRFECTDVTEESLLLHHYTHREGLAPFVRGLVSGLGKRFGTPATCELVRPRGAGQDHDVFRVTWEG